MLVPLAALGPLPGHGGFDHYFPVGLLLIDTPFQSDTIRDAVMNLSWGAAWLVAYVLVQCLLVKVALWCVSLRKAPAAPGL